MKYYEVTIVSWPKVRVRKLLEQGYFLQKIFSKCSKLPAHVIGAMTVNVVNAASGKYVDVVLIINVADLFMC